MPNCSVKHCGARYRYTTNDLTNKQPNLTLHRLPKSETLRKKWLEAIGVDNINPKHKNVQVCSIHFEETSFNRTLGMMRLRDDAIPSIFLSPNDKMENTECEENKTQDVQKYFVNQEEMLNDKTENTNEDNKTQDVQKYFVTQEDKVLRTEDYRKRKEEEKIRKLTERCNIQRMKMKRLNEQIRNRNTKIAALNEIFKNLKKSSDINTEDFQLLTECSLGPEDFLKRQITTSGGHPVKKKYSEDIRKFAMTLHFLSPKAYSYIRQSYNCYLPNPQTLSKWYKHVIAEPGFTEEAFEEEEL